MAEFCKQCSLDQFGFDTRELANLGPPCEEGTGYVALCEGCGPTLVDHEGACVSKSCLIDHTKGQVRQSSSNDADLDGW